jgi:hypothetical protein
LQEKETIEQQIKNEDFDNKISEIKTKIANPQSSIQEEQNTIKLEQENNIKNMEILRDFLKTVDYKKLDELNNEYKKNENDIKELEKQIINQEELQSSQEKYQQEKIRLETSIQQKESQK